ncbi:MAG TPA: flavin reductase family protein [Cellvibrio sp.]|nr:flavin reductase family protein [Cellvibrio sp.]
MQTKSISEQMRLGMRRLASGVCVISADVGGEHFAMTASSVTSVSDNPPSLLVCINKLVSQQEYFSRSGSVFAVNILGESQQAVSDLCAGREPGRDRFSLGQWVTDSASPYLADAQAVFFCETDMLISYGTHQIVIAHIKRVEIADVGFSPLIYADGSYGKFVHQ